MKSHCKRWLWPVLAGLGLVVNAFPLTAGAGTLYGTVKPVYLDDGSPPVPLFIEAQVLDAKDARLVAVLPVGVDSTFGGDLKAGQYRLCFRFRSEATKTCWSFYAENATKPQALCFEEGTVITITEGAKEGIYALVGYSASRAIPVTKLFRMDGWVKNLEGDALPGIVVDVLDACSANVWLTATTDQDGWFYFKGGLSDSKVKVRFADPAGEYRTSFYRDNADNFIAGDLVDPLVVITVEQMLLPVSPDIEVAPLVADFGNVELPGSATTVVTIQNIGGSDLQVSALTLAAGSSPYVSIKSAPALPLTLAADASCEVTLEFEPRTLGPAAATLAVVSDDADEGTVLVSLNGQGVASSAPPAEQVATTLEFYEESAAEGTLQGTGPAGSGDAHLEALLNQIKAASDLAAAGKLDAACKQLENALKRTDGDPQPPDFVTGPAAAQLRLLIELTRLAMGCK